MTPTELANLVGLTLLAVFLFYWMGLTFLTLAVALIENKAEGFTGALGIALRELPFAISFSLMLMLMWLLEASIEAWEDALETVGRSRNTP